MFRYINFIDGGARRRGTCCAVSLKPQLFHINAIQLEKENINNHGSIALSINCNVLAGIIFEENIACYIAEQNFGLSN